MVPSITNPDPVKDIDKEDGALSHIETTGDGTIEGETHEIRREFKPRQVFMFAIASSIGTGLVIGSGGALAKGGPGSLFIAYCIIGITVFFVMTALGEMATFLPMKKGFSGYATRMVDPALGFAVGWNYVFNYCMATPTNLSAAGLIIQYWRPDLNVAIWITLFGLVVIGINVAHVSKFGELEFWLSVLKVITMTATIIISLVVSLGGAPNHDRVGFRYWSNPGAFAEHIFKDDLGKFLGFWACICQACFTYTGVEVVGMTFGETPNPRRNVPRAINQTFWRIIIFYVLNILVMGMAVPYNSPELLGAQKQSTSAAASPFVAAIKIGGIAVLPDVINAALIVFTLSAAVSDVYCSSRALYGLARDGQAPKFFGTARSNGNPLWAVCFACIFIAVGYLNASKSSAQVFGYLTSLVTIFSVLNWVGILVSHISFRMGLKAQGISLADLPYCSILQPWGSYVALVISCLVLLFSGYDAFVPVFRVDIFILKYIGVVLFLFNIGWWKIFKKTSRVTASNMSLISGRREFEEREYVEDAEWQRAIL